MKQYDNIRQLKQKVGQKESSTSDGDVHGPWLLETSFVAALLLFMSIIVKSDNILLH